MMAASSHVGGCWYCQSTEGDLRFSWDFDCLLHLDCLQKRLMEHPDDREALLFAMEFAYDLGMDSEAVERRWKKTL